MSETAKDKLEKQIAGARAAEERAVMGLIQLELDGRTAGIHAAHDQARAALEDAEAALVEPLAQLAQLEVKIVAAEGKCSDLRQRIDQLAADDDDEDAPDNLAAARMQLAEREARVTRLHSKRDFAESGFRPLFEVRDHAVAWVKVYRGAKAEVAEGMADPFGPLGQQTQAYEAYRMPSLFPVLLLHDRESREWDKAVEELEFLVGRLGFKLVYDAERAAQALRAEMADAADAELAPSPNAADIMAADVVKLINETTPPSRIEDHRNTPAPPRDYMQVPGRGAR